MTPRCWISVSSLSCLGFFSVLKLTEKVEDSGWHFHTQFCLFVFFTRWIWQSEESFLHTLNLAVQRKVFLACVYSTGSHSTTPHPCTHKPPPLPPLHYPPHPHPPYTQTHTTTTPPLPPPPHPHLRTHKPPPLPPLHYPTPPPPLYTQTATTTTRPLPTPHPTPTSIHTNRHHYHPSITPPTPPPPLYTQTTTTTTPPLPPHPPTPHPCTHKPPPLPPLHYPPPTHPHPCTHKPPPLPPLHYPPHPHPCTHKPPPLPPLHYPTPTPTSVHTNYHLPSAISPHPSHTPRYFLFFLSFFKVSNCLQNCWHWWTTPVMISTSSFFSPFLKLETAYKTVGIGGQLLLWLASGDLSPLAVAMIVQGHGVGVDVAMTTVQVCHGCSSGVKGWGWMLLWQPFCDFVFFLKGLVRDA